MPKLENDDILTSAPDDTWIKVPNLDNTPHVFRCGPVWYRREGEEGSESASLSMGWRVTPEDTNAMGFAHGGALMTFADFALASAGMRHAEDRTVTMQFECNFINGAPLGSWLRTDITKIRKGTLCFITGRILAKKRVVLNFSGITKNLDK